MDELGTVEVAERYWNGEFDSLPDNCCHPVGVTQPTRKIALLEPGFGFVMNFGNVTCLESDEGLVLIDCGTRDNGRRALSQAQKAFSKPVHTCIYTHGHIDHCMGILSIEEAQTKSGGSKVRVISHENVPTRFNRYVKTNNYNALINSRQFQVKIPHFPSEYRYPDLTYSSSLEVEVGSKKKEKLYLFHDKGETDDSTWVWIPEKKALCTGDLFIWATPNCGNPQKVQRYPFDWAIAMKKMIRLDAEYLLPGHGPPIIGKERIRQALADTIQFLDSICGQALTLINSGKSLNDVIHSVKVDPELLKRPYLRPVYDDPEFVIRNIWRQLCGWWDLNPAHLRSVEDKVLAKELTSLIGKDRFLQRTKELSSQHLNLAVQFIEFALKAYPDDLLTQELAYQIYKQKEKQEVGTMARGVYSASKMDAAMAVKRLRSRM